MFEKEFCTRFEDRVRLWYRAGRRAFDMEADDYSRSVAKVWWRETKDGALSPERCADEDSYYW
ncbi:hypothetical protein ASD32_24575 [Rhizobium sp. Root483D2]|nr:hypothetical protein ASD32_24575 [Rhizobium sp. Root483D2]